MTYQTLNEAVKTAISDNKIVDTPCSVMATFPNLSAEIRDAIAETDALYQKYGCKSLTGAELEAAKGECTPLAKIKPPFSKNIPTPHGPMQVGVCGRRNESPTKAWGRK